MPNSENPNREYQRTIEDARKARLAALGRILLLRHPSEVTLNGILEKYYQEREQLMLDLEDLCGVLTTGDSEFVDDSSTWCGNDRVGFVRTIIRALDAIRQIDTNSEMDGAEQYDLTLKQYEVIKTAYSQHILRPSDHKARSEKKENKRNKYGPLGIYPSWVIHYEEE